MYGIKEYDGFNYSGEYDDKKRIVLTHTSRNLDEYLTSLKKRRYGKNLNIPHYVIGRDGFIHKLLSHDKYSEYLDEKSINRSSIVISLENLGWLEKEPLKDYHLNWIGDIYKGKVFEKKWRDRHFWEPYTEDQIISLLKLLTDITEETGIEFNVVEHNTLIKKIEKYGGVVTRSNFSKIYTDLNPSFDFEKFLKKIENE